tara:strand:+ start:4250 stop:5377 length:1128 start_codon:yes stop_codon:yes gene_type:complete
VSILLISGEVSGDIYAATLANYLKKLNSNLFLAGIGGKKLKESVDEFVFESAYSHGIGLESLTKKGQFKKELLRHIKICLETYDIKKVVIIDFQHYNFDIANVVKLFNVEIDTFITPNFWMWRSVSKAKKVLRYSRHIYTIFQKEYDFYSSLANNVYYFGHPLTDSVFIDKFKPKHSKPVDRIKKITFFPGSRMQEIKLYIDPILDTIAKLKAKNPNYKFRISISAMHYYDFIKNKLLSYQLSEDLLVFESSEYLYADSDIVVAAAGTTTLEAILSNTLIVVLAALPPLSFLYAKLFLGSHFKFVSLPNFISDQLIVPELVQSEINSDNIMREISFLNKNKKSILNSYDLVRNNIAKSKNVFENVSKSVLSNEIS